MTDPVPCKSCGKSPLVQEKTTDRNWSRTHVWIAGCRRCRWNNSGYRDTKEIAIEKWNEKQEEDDV